MPGICFFCYVVVGYNHINLLSKEEYFYNLIVGIRLHIFVVPLPSVVYTSGYFFLSVIDFSIPNPAKTGPVLEVICDWLFHETISLKLVTCIFEMQIDGGSVDEGSIKSDEEYDDLTMQDDQDNGGLYACDYESRARPIPASGSLSEFLHNNSKRADIYPPTLDMFLRTQSDSFREQNGQHYSPLVDRSDKKTPCSVHLRTFKRSLSIPITRRDKQSNDPTDP